MSFSKAILMVAAVFLTSINAHMVMKTPTPYGKSSLDNSPLAADGSNFPCKQRSGVYDAQGASNIMPIGVNQTLSFTGSAVHGGGSCQISLTSDKQPSKSSQWQVIHSIIGGCPASAVGNIGDDPHGSGAAQFEYSIPEGITAGDYTLAWTWFNKVGNREMYMNCAPVTVTGGSKKRDAEEAFAEGSAVSKRAPSFPAMFQANIGNGCATADNGDVIFPNPGDSVQHAGSQDASKPPVGSCGGSGSSPGGSPAAAQAPAPVAPSAVAPSITPVVAPSGSSAAPSTYTILASSAAPAVASPVASSPVAPSPIASAAPTGVSPPSGSSTGSSSSSGSTSSGGLTGACSTEGQFNCVGGSSFQQCASGVWSVVQPMAGGTKCTGGQQLKLNITLGKRHLRFARGHIRRGHPLGSW